MTNIRKLVLSLAVLILASASLALAQGTYTQIDYPGATLTYSFSIDTAGDISGSYNDAGRVTHGFILSGGIYTSVDYPGISSGTALSGLNDLGEVVGNTIIAPVVGFLYDISTQAFTKIRCSDGVDTVPLSINNAGTTVGYTRVGQSVLGFELGGSTCRRITPPGAQDTYVYGISGSGQFVGYYFHPAITNFSEAQGKYVKVTIPGAPGANVYGISPDGGTLAGHYPQTPPVNVGFLYQNGTLQTVQFPGSNNTFVFGVNDSGVAVGVFSDSSGVEHGFTWTPADAEKK